jgi:hypothetical protein
MTREEQKAYNAENYPASVLTWLHEATDRSYDDFESRTCGNCEFGHKEHDEKILCNQNYHIVDTFGDYVNDAILYVEPNFGCNQFKAKDI